MYVVVIIINLSALGAPAGKRTLKDGVIPSIKLPHAKSDQPAVSKQKRAERAQKRKRMEHDYETQGLVAYSEMGAEEEG